MAGGIWLGGAGASVETVSVGTMTLGVIVAGFTATQRNMIVGMAGAKVIQFIMETEHYQDFLTYLSQCLYGALFVSAISVPGMFLDQCSLAWSIWVSIWAGSVITVLAMMLRNEIVMSQISRHYLQEKGVTK